MNVDIKGYEEYYKISDKGVVTNKKTNKNMKPSLNSSGYLRCALNVNYKKNNRFFIHRLVAEHFILNKENKPCVNHIDGNKLNNSVDNLEWVSYSENIKHAFDLGLNKSGEEHGQSKLTCKEVKKILSRYKNENISQRKLGQIYDVAHSTIGAIVRGETWE